MALPTKILDLWTDDEGDVDISANGDLRVARDSECVEQEVLWRLKTTKGDWQLVPNCGADLETIVGLPNSEETGGVMEGLIDESLTHDSLFSGNLVDVNAFPINKNEIAAAIAITYGGETLTSTVVLDLKEGVLNTV